MAFDPSSEHPAILASRKSTPGATSRRALLKQVSRVELDLLVDRFMSQECMEAVMAFMAKQAARERRKRLAKL